MRSRFTAYGRGDAAYLSLTWHPSTRPAVLHLEGGPRWLRLEIIDARSDGDRGTVEFMAWFLDRSNAGVLHETSRFVREQGRWWYVDGTIHPATGGRIGRNDPCPCGSGRKFKRCCDRA